MLISPGTLVSEVLCECTLVFDRAVDILDAMIIRELFLRDNVGSAERLSLDAWKVYLMECRDICPAFQQD